MPSREVHRAVKALVKATDSAETEKARQALERIQLWLLAGTTALVAFQGFIPVLFALWVQDDAGVMLFLGYWWATMLGVYLSHRLMTRWRTRYEAIDAILTGRAVIKDGKVIFPGDAS